MSKQSQKEAVFAAVTAVVNEAGIIVNDGDSFGGVMTRELRAQITSILAEGFNNGSISLDKTFNSDSELRTYCSGVTSNWLRKDPRLNGGVKYQAANPGSRVGHGDAQLKAMRALLNTTQSEEDRVEIQGFIDQRVNEIRASRKPIKQVDFSALPAELAAKYNK